ncbi:OsmC family protein [Streptomyces sp. NPDC001102]
MNDDFGVVVSAGSLRSGGECAVRFPHRWTPEGVTVEADFTGAHLLHLAAAGCVLNDLYREAAGLGITLDGVRVTASGGFDTGNWASTGIGYSVTLDSAAPAADLDRLLDVVDEVAEIPRTLRAGASVVRRPR